jgi:hypothetical protein
MPARFLPLSAVGWKQLSLRTTTVLLRLKAGGNLERNDFGRKLDERGRRTGRQRQAVQVMIGDYNDDL